MTYRDILVHLDGEDPTGAGARRRDYAIALAALFEARLTGVVYALEPAMPPMIMGEVPGTLIESQRRTSVEAAEASARSFDDAASAAGLAHETLYLEAREGSAPESFARRARAADLAVVGQVQPDDPLPVRELLIESALFDTGRPVLIVPHAGADRPRLERALVAWDGHREAARAAHDAIPLLSRADRVEVVAVDDGRRKPVDSEPDADLAGNLSRHGLPVTADRIAAAHGDVAETLLARVAETRADLLVMGGYGHSRLREFVLGGATRGVLDATTVPVLMAH